MMTLTKYLKLGLAVAPLRCEFSNPAHPSCLHPTEVACLFVFLAFFTVFSVDLTIYEQFNNQSTLYRKGKDLHGRGFSWLFCERRSQ